ncbi:class I SAM-dependent methyltransferase [Gelidibacter salicanalis]|uniref:Class I SAM-dependent methyltransferase n=1 Tax=Gelidibacter salicanalis TaxID=291193 RepID=A0A934NBZ9_9FLAO|nr:class I SAM-dependent methyltransferase [Gelidibacter salicanalis]MBJ7880185.1 class I SAM-dependent methyltransferase [Gelidibacter salicanalis]
MKKKAHITKKVKTPWPTKKAMEQVYAMKLWGNNHSEFYSGEGSHQPDLVNPYIDVLTRFLISFETPLVVCDLGCGDFNVGKDLVKFTDQYIAVDIVADLIEHNKEQFKEDNLDFQCLDIAVDALPVADCAIIRQVLQHLSNAEIQRIVPKLANFKNIVVTEHLPEGDFIPNKDIISGQGTRLKKESGLNLVVSPFNFKVKAEKILSSVKLNQGRGVIVTTLYTVF